MKLPLFHHLVTLLFPEVCAACGQLLFKTEKTVCLSCQHLLPLTGYEHIPDNPVARIFWGRVHLEAATACYFFSKRGKVQQLVHELKYKKNRDAGHFLGVETGKTIRQTDWGKQIDQIIPVPLHPKKQRIRGYNQSEVLAYGIREATGIAVVTNNLVRTVASETQTKKSREARWENVKDIFRLQQPEDIEGKHVLLVDDVITTGSTIEACVHTLQQAPNARISVVAAACAPA